MDLKIIEIRNPNTYEIIIGQGNFSVKAVDDLYLTILSSAPNVKAAVAMNEAKPKLTRVNGNDDELVGLASETARDIGAGHIFVVYMKGAFPMHVLPYIKELPTVCRIYAATSNPCQAVVAETGLGRALLGIVDGTSATKVENEEERKQRRQLVEKLGFKLP
jgi:adenosine/AMP kinase